jgi:transposase
MKVDLSKLPDDANIDKETIVSLVGDIETSYHEKIHYLEEQIRVLKNELFGRKSEKRSAGPDDRQLPIFDSDLTDDQPSDNQKSEAKIVIGAHQRKKAGRKPLPDNLPRVEIIHDLDEEEKVCQCGASLSRIGADTCEKLDYIPAKVQVEHHIRYKYACKSCEGVEDDGPTVKIAPLPAQLIEKSNATEGLLAHIIVSKFADALPLYRQQKIFARLGIEMPRATMANWVIKAAARCAPIIEMLQNQIRSGPWINIDESSLQVLKEPGRKNTTKSYMWVFCTGPPNSPCVLYRYQPTRSGKVALGFLENYRGYIQSDDYKGYDHLGRKEGIVHLGCWAHARRRFSDVVKTRKKIRGKKASVKPLADEALDYIGKLYRIEKKARDEQLTADQIYQLRQQHAKPVLDQFEKWLEAKKPLTPPGGLLGKAISYTMKNWSKLIVYIEDGNLKPDNNIAENAIRPFVVGRKNWLFSGSPSGAEASATFFTLIETAKANGLEPYGYLRYLFRQLPIASNKQDYLKLLPQNVNRDNIARPRE